MQFLVSKLHVKATKNGLKNLTSQIDIFLETVNFDFEFKITPTKRDFMQKILYQKV